MKEYIEREKAFDAVFGQFCASSDETEAALNAAIEEIRAIPAANVRPVVRSEWKIHHKTNIAVCKCCSYQYMMGAPWHEYPPRFCPNCGAWMEES